VLTNAFSGDLAVTSSEHSAVNLPVERSGEGFVGRTLTAAGVRRVGNDPPLRKIRIGLVPGFAPLDLHLLRIGGRVLCP
jgi:hypothetical protein